MSSDKTPEQKHDTFLKDNNIEVVQSLVVTDQALLNCLKPSVVQAVLSCYSVKYEIKEKPHEKNPITYASPADIAWKPRPKKR